MSHTALHHSIPDRKGDWMQTFTGRVYWPLDPRPADIHIHDIAHALSMLCRYTGHCVRFYSVAEHSVHVSHLVPPKFAFQGLMHDAAEAYTNDIARPLKPYLANYDTVESENWAAVCQVFGIPLQLDPSVKEMDNRICRSEKEQNMRASVRDSDWSHLGEPAAVHIQCWTPEVAERKFLERFAALVGGR